MSFGLNDLSAAASLAHLLWRNGFESLNNAPTQYAEFGQEIKRLGENLQAVVIKAEEVTYDEGPPIFGQPNPRWDLSSLLDISGDFKDTLAKSQQILQNHISSSRDHGIFSPVTNIRWNMTIRPVVERLRERLKIHNRKILFALKPLEIKLILDLRSFTQHSFQQLARGNDRVQDTVNRILQNQNLPPGATPLPPAAGPITPEVPDYVKFRLDAVLDLEYRSSRDFPLRVGVNAFTYHFLECTTRVSPDGESPASASLKSYLNLMKSIFILQKIKEGADYERKVNHRGDPMWISYMEELEERCRTQFQRYTLEEPEETRLQAPTRHEVVVLFQDDFRLWFKDDRSTGEDGIPDISVELNNEILNLTLASSTQHHAQELGLVRLSPKLLQLQSLRMERDGSHSTERTISTVHLENADMIPMWADLDNPGATWKLRFRGARDQIDQQLQFANCRDLYQFQQAITGYKVSFNNQCRDVKFRTFYSSESLWSSRETKQTIGKIQLWYSRRIDSNSSSSASLSSPSSPSLPNLHAASDLRIPRRPLPGDALLAQPVPLSNGFLGPPLPTLSPYPRRTSHVSTASRISVPSSVTTTDTAATTFSNASIKTYLSSQTSGIVSSDGNIEAYKPEKPPEPMLVLLIRKDHHGRKKTSLLGVKLDAKTALVKACSCKVEAHCIHAQIERASNTDLVAYRLPPSTLASTTTTATATSAPNAPALQEWNLAALGEHQLAQRAVRAPKLKWVQVAFDRPEERAEFAGQLRRVREIWANQCRAVAYRRERDGREAFC